MKIPNEKKIEFNELLSQYESGMFPADVIAFCAGKLIIDYQSPDFIKSLPPEISLQLFNMIKTLKDKGEVFSYSSLGETDYTDFARELGNVIEQNTK